MAGETSGRLFLIKKAGVALLGLKENSVSIDGSPVDVTDKLDGGFRTFADFAGSKSLEISASGVIKDNVLRNLAMGTGSLLLTDVVVEYPDGTRYGCNLYLASAEFSGSHEGENTYDVTLQSSGAWTQVA